MNREKLLTIATCALFAIGVFFLGVSFQKYRTPKPENEIQFEIEKITPESAYAVLRALEMVGLHGLAAWNTKPGHSQQMREFGDWTFRAYRDPNDPRLTTLPRNFPHRTISKREGCRKRMLTPIAQILGKSDQFRTYADKLRDPRWEHCRSQFVRRHGNKCSSCNRKGIEVQVHHKVYRRGVEPWDHPETDLILLCRGCHQDWHDLLQEFRSKVIGTIPVSVARVIIRALNLLLHFNRPASVGYALAQLACEEATVTHLSARYQAEDRKHQ